jgi:hypothetical protein
MLGLSLPDTPGDATETQDAIFIFLKLFPQVLSMLLSTNLHTHSWELMKSVGSNGS